MSLPVLEAVQLKDRTLNHTVEPVQEKLQLSFQFVKMSAEILAAPDSSLNVRLTSRENRGEGEETEVEILEDEEHHADLRSQQASKS